MENTQSGAHLAKGEEGITFTELDASDRWIKNIDRSVQYARRVHGDKYLTQQDMGTWLEFLSRWNPFLKEMKKTTVALMNTENKKHFDVLMNESKKLHDDFVKKGLVQIPVPYAAELVTLLRTMPKRLNAAQMYAKLSAGVKCGDQLLNENRVWWQWVLYKDNKGLVRAIDQAKQAAAIFARSRDAGVTYVAGDPAYDEFLRRLTAIWIEAAGLYGMQETRTTAVAEGKDVANQKKEETWTTLLMILGAAAIAYIGLKWTDNKVSQVGVPDAHGPDPRNPYDESPRHATGGYATGGYATGSYATAPQEQDSPFNMFGSVRNVQPFTYSDRTPYATGGPHSENR